MHGSGRGRGMRGYRLGTPTSKQMTSAATVTLDGRRSLPKRMAAHLENVDSTTVLGEDDLRDVISAVTDLTGRWKDLGISLGIRLSELNAILSTNPQSPNDCLREMLALWLKQNYNATNIGSLKVSNNLKYIQRKDKK